MTKNAPNNFVLLSTKMCFEITKIWKIASTVDAMDSIRLEGNVWRLSGPHYDKPLDSSVLSFWRLENEPTETKQTINLNQISSKLIRYTDADDSYALKLLHT